MAVRRIFRSTYTHALYVSYIIWLFVQLGDEFNLTEKVHKEAQQIQEQQKRNKFKNNQFKNSNSRHTTQANADMDGWKHCLKTDTNQCNAFHAASAMADMQVEETRQPDLLLVELCRNTRTLFPNSFMDDGQLASP